MGSNTHHAIVVTSWNNELLDEFVAEAERVGATIVGPSKEVVNGYRTVLVCPDGSKDGWQDSATADLARDLLKDWIDEQRYDDGSSSIEWVEVAFGNDAGYAQVEDCVSRRRP